MSRAGASLQRNLIIIPLLAQFVTLLAAAAILLAVAIRVDSGGPYVSESLPPTVAKAIVRGPDGNLALRMTPELSAIRAETPNLWFAAQDDLGRRIAFGPVPARYARLVEDLNEVTYGQLRGRYPPYEITAALRREVGPAGPLTVLAHGKLERLGWTIMLASNVIVVPICLALALISIIVTPWIVGRCLAGISRIAREAEQIGVEQRGRRLSEEHVPKEIAPLIRAVNDALRRLDERYEQQRRFIASAGHELRTPIAILRIKIESALEAGTRRLLPDVERLGTLAEQLLDIQRLDADHDWQTVDLASLVRRVVGDLAPLLIASGNSIEVQIDGVGPLQGDEASIERVITNLVHNAIEHGGHHVLVRAFGTTLEVEDDGPGIPEKERERVFEPFHRLRPRATGSGLGLTLVQQVVERHAGRVTIIGAPEGGTIVRIGLPTT